MGMGLEDAEDYTRQLLQSESIDLVELRRLARRPGGYQTNCLRKLIWPKLLGVNRHDTVDYKAFLHPHRDDYQIECDVTRLWGRLQPMAERCDAYQSHRRKHVSEMISAVLCRNRSLFYYQGYHDIASSFLLVLEDNHLTFAVLEAASSLYFVDFMGENFDLFARSMRLIMLLIRSVDWELFAFLDAVPNFEPFFTCSWIITWFSHDLHHMDQIGRLFDVLLTSEPCYSYYLCTALLLKQRDVILGTDPDLASVHSLLLASPSLLWESFDELIQEADKLLVDVPMSKLLRQCDRPLAALLKAKPLRLFSTPAVLKSKSIRADWLLLKDHQLNMHSQRLNGTLPAVFWLEDEPDDPPTWWELVMDVCRGHEGEIYALGVVMVLSAAYIGRLTQLEAYSL